MNVAPLPWLICVVCFLLTGCNGLQKAEVVVEIMPTPTATATTMPSPTPTASPSPSPSPTITPTPTATLPPKLAIFEPLSIDALSQREYGGSGIVLKGIAKDPLGFTQYSMSYESDGLTITGLVNIPDGDGPFPVAVLNHGYIIPTIYRPGMDTWLMGEDLVYAGYIVLMPDYRNYWESDIGPNDFRTGYAIDIMNLLAQVWTLPTADSKRIGIIGHSMGGEISMWPMVISKEVDAVVLYASMSGDAGKNWAWRYQQWPIQRDAMEALALRYGTPDEAPDGYALISPETYFERTQMPVMIHHGTADPLVPYHWSEDMFGKLTDAGVDVTFHTYYNAEHSFGGGVFDLFMARNLAFFEEHVRNNVNTERCRKRPCP